MKSRNNLLEYFCITKTNAIKTRGESNITRNHAYIRDIVEFWGNSFSETINIIVCKVLRSNDLVVSELVNSKNNSLYRH